MAWQLPRDRIDLVSGAPIEGRPKWTTEEIQAWLDYEAQGAEEVERLVEAEVQQAGGYGQSRERGTRGLIRRIEAESASLQELYRYAP